MKMRCCLFFRKLSSQLLILRKKIKLEKPIELKEIVTVIRSLRSGKAPGSDGFVADFYKKFSEKLAPVL